MCPGHRIQDVETLGNGVYRVSFHFGYRERPDLMRLLRAVKERHLGDELNLDDVLFNFTRERVFVTNKHNMPHILKLIFTMQVRNSQPLFRAVWFSHRIGRWRRRIRSLSCRGVRPSIRPPL